MGLTFLDFFSGIGGFRLGMEMAGHKCLGHCEIDKFADKSYRAMHDMKEDEWYANDIRGVDPRDLPEADCWCGGFPCQSFSIAGKRAGFEDMRGTLIFEIFRLAAERKPKILFLENVAGLLNHDGGRTFATILCGLWELGYDVQWQVLNSKNFGVPQNRERVFIIGHLGGFSGRKIFPIREDGNSLTKACGIKRASTTISGCLTATDEKMHMDGNYIVQAVLTPDRAEKRQNGRRMKEPGEEMFTLTEQDKHGVMISEPSGIYTNVSEDFIRPPMKGLSKCLKANNHDAGVIDKKCRIRRLTPRECFRLQGFSDTYFDRAATVNSDSQLYKQAGNSVTVNVIYEIAKRLGYGEGEKMQATLDLIEPLEEIIVDADLEEWKRNKSVKRAKFVAMQQLPYEVKIRRAEQRAKEFEAEMEKRGCNCHTSVGGLDSLTLHLFLKSIGINVPAISVSGVEDKSIQRVHKELGIIKINSYRSKVEVLNDIGFPVISKKMAGRIDLLQNPTEKNKTVRNAIITGTCGELGHFAKNSSMKLPQKWLNLFGGMANEEYGTHYKEAPFKVSNKCCYYLKEKPCDDWAREHNSYPYLGMMASEGGQREEALMEHGCNYYGKTVMRSAPFAPFVRQDILQLALDLKVPVPEIYGEIVRDPNGELRTTRAQRTGCSMCGFGIHMEERPHRFDRLREDNPKEWEFWMYKCCTDKVTGENYGWGKVLDYIGVEWEDDWNLRPKQLDIFELMEV